MPSVDDRIVRMEFDNAAFERKIKTTLDSLSQLDKALKFTGATKGLSDVSAAAEKVHFGTMHTAIDSISAKFLALSTVAITALANITTHALQAGTQVAKAFTLQPVIEGFREYELQLESVQTILANTVSKGTTLDEVSAALDRLNQYADQTIYNFGQMARNIGTFTAAGVDLETSVASIKGIANLAALSGSSAEQASTAMYQLSQAIATGTLKLIDWNSVVNAGMGGEVFQNALFETGKAMKTLAGVPMDQTFQQWKDAGNSFRDSLQDGWITADVLTTTLETFTGDMTEEMLIAKGFSQETATNILKIAATAKAAATEVKTFRQLMSTTKEAVSTGWADSFKIIIGNFTEAKELWTSVSNSINGFVQRSSDARNNLLQSWKDMGGRALLIMSLQTAFRNLVEVLKPIKEAFQNIFPPLTAERLIEMTKAFAEFTVKLKPSTETINKLRSIFQGLFSVLSIGWEVIKEGIKFIADLGKQLLGLVSPGVTGFFAKIGDGLTKLHDALVKGGGIKDFFAGLSSVLQKPLDLLKKLKDAISEFFSSFKSDVADKAGESMGRLGDRFKSLKGIFEGIGNLWQPFENALMKITDVLARIWDVLSSWFKELGQKLADVLSAGDFNNILDAINVGLLGGIVLLLRKFLKEGFKFDVTGGVLDKIGASFEQLTGVLTAMQTNIKANALMKIAGAIAILTASVVVLSMIDSAALTRALTAMAIGFGQLLGAFSLFTKIMASPMAAVSFTTMSTGLILLSTAILILSLAVRSMASLSWEDLTKGLLGISLMLGLLVVATKPLAANSKGMVVAGVGITAMAIALTILGGAVKVFASMSWEEMGQGLLGMALALAAITLAVNLMPNGASMALQGVGLIAIALGMSIIAGVIALFGKMDWGTLGKGMVGLAGGLLIIAGAMHLMPANLPLTAAGLILVGIALGLIAKAVGKMGEMSWAEIARGLVALGGSLLIIAAAMYAMQNALPGAAALLIISVALGMLVAVLKVLGKMSWDTILDSLLKLGVALAAIAVVSLLLQPAVGAIAGLAAALLLLGAAVALFGVGAFLLGKGLEAIAKSGAAAAEAIPKILEAIATAIPTVLKAVAKGILEMLEVFVDAAPRLAKVLGTLLNILLDELEKLIPKAGRIIRLLIEELFKIIKSYATQYIDLGFFIITHLLQGISQHLPEIIQAGVDIIVNFINGITQNLDRIVTAVTQLIITFVTSIATHYQEIITAGVQLFLQFLWGILSNIVLIVQVVSAMITTFIEAVGAEAIRIAQAATDMITTFVTSIGNNLIQIFWAAVSVITKFIETLGAGAQLLITAGGDVIIDVIEGFGTKATDVVTAGVNTVIKFIEGLGQNALKLATAAMDVVIDFLDGLAKAIDEKSGEFREAGGRLIGAIINGMTFGLAGKIKGVFDEFAGHAKSAFETVKSAATFGIIGDPYSVRSMHIGEAIINGFTRAFDRDTSMKESIEEFGKRSTDVLTKLYDSLSEMDEFNPVITPVLDLTQVAAGSAKLGNYLSYNQAQLIASGQNAIQQDALSSTVPTGVNFQQIINAPEQLSTSDIYKQTRNQITMAKEELSIP